MTLEIQVLAWNRC